MAKLLQHTASLVIKIDGKFDLPEDKKCKTVTIKKLLHIMQKEPAAIQFLGYDFDKPYIENETVEDCLLISIHVIEDPIMIDYSESTEQIVKHFVKQLKRNTSRIMLQSSRTASGKQERHFEFYVRGIAESGRAIRTLRQA